MHTIVKEIMVAAYLNNDLLVAIIKIHLQHLYDTDASLESLFY